MPRPGLAGRSQRSPPPSPRPPRLQALAVQIARQDYSGYDAAFSCYPSISLMIKTGLWIELEAAVGFILGLGLASLMGQRTGPVILMIVLQLILTPILSAADIPHLLNLQRSVVGLAMAHLEPAGAADGFRAAGGGRRRRRAGGTLLLPESTAVAVCVIVAWLVGWTILGAWRMMTRDA